MNWKRISFYILDSRIYAQTEEVPANAYKYTSAIVACETLSKVVAVPRSNSDTETLKTVFANSGKSGPVLIGITKGGGSVWRDTANQELTYTNWATGQPDNSYDCATMSHNDGKWSTQLCDTASHFICREALSGGTSSGECALFSGSCSIQSGFSISISSSCRAERYSALPDDFAGIYVTSNTSPKVLAADHATTIASLDSNCQFDSTGILNFAFDQCGTVETDTDSQGTTVSIYGHHYIEVGDTTLSYISPPLKVDCFMAGVNLDNSVDTETTEEIITFTQTAAEIVTALSIELQIGTVDDVGTFTAATESTEYAVGTEVHVKVSHATTDFGFALFDCSAGGVALFTDYCPSTQAASLFNTAFISHEEFKLNIFQSGDLDSVIFNCNLRIYAAEADEPADCTSRMTPTWKNGGAHKDAEVVAVGRITASEESSDWTITTLVGLTMTQWIFYTNH
ncbi:unnamed protein product [Oikopleura dioica]|uniref:C-type lectin domain-containing protein n=1 Tax=Oikopleura dioica TaxID=34765 RepID=E4XF84_OIKDI|nr:unnamed protein product [Oikopleura dioica]CBY38966.1 unnamed protein product [Oikopleura dioica]